MAYWVFCISTSAEYCCKVQRTHIYRLDMLLGKVGCEYCLLLLDQSDGLRIWTFLN